MGKALKMMTLSGLLAFGCFWSACDNGGSSGDSSLAGRDNPFLSKWSTPYGLPDFGLLKLEDYRPAFDAGIEQQQQEIEQITASTQNPTFANTIEALEVSGSLLRKVSNVFYALNGALTNQAIQDLAKDMAPLLSAHRDAIKLNDSLFQRVNTVFDERESLGLDPVQMRLLTETHKGFVRAGALLPKMEKETLMGLNKQLSLLTLQFGQNVLKETNSFEMILTDQADLAGLPEGVIQAAAESAQKRGAPAGSWAFTLHKPSLIPFLQYSTKRDLRQRMFSGYAKMGDNGDALDNNRILEEIASLRLQKANLLGYETHAHYVLDDNMARQPEKVYDLLERVWSPAIKRAGEEVALLQKMIDDEAAAAGHPSFKLQGWDWWHYAEKVKKQQYDLDEEMLRPYFQMENVRSGMFEVAHRLFGLNFQELPDAPRYHDEVQVFLVTGPDDTEVAVLSLDYFPRESKRGGAWMSAFRKQTYADGKRITPLIFNVGNFTRPAGDKPALLSVDEVGTMFHEFGHALHGMLSDVQYRSLSGTSVAQDFVELPSQVMENWAFEPEVLHLYAKHFQSGELIPEELVEKLEKSKHFNQGFATTEYLAASFLDMDWHTLTSLEGIESTSFESQSMAKIGLIDEIISRYRSPYFRHIFSGGYSAGYYSYLWAEVLDADAFEAFKETGNIFDAATAKAFQEYILQRGGSEEPMELYRKFRGKEPGPEALLKRRGLAG
jgi:peptidyl-dipeptidase Dcp